MKLKYVILLCSLSLSIAAPAEPAADEDGEAPTTDLSTVGEAEATEASEANEPLTTEDAGVEDDETGELDIAVTLSLDEPTLETGDVDAITEAAEGGTDEATTTEFYPSEPAAPLSPTTTPPARVKGGWPAELTRLSDMCAPITLPSPIKTCNNKWFYLGRNLRFRMLCPHWAWIPAYKQRLVHTNMEIWRRVHGNKWVMKKNVQITTHQTKDGKLECGFVRDQTEGKVLYRGCPARDFWTTTGLITRVVHDEAVKPEVDASSLGWIYKLKWTYDFVVQMRSCIALIRVMLPIA